MTMARTAVLTGQEPEEGSGKLRADLAFLGFTVTDDARAALLGQAGGDERLALIDRRFVGHRHALRLALADPRHLAAHLPGVLVVQGSARHALTLLVDHPESLEPDRLAGQLASSTRVHHIDPGELVATVPGTQHERDLARAAVAAVNEDTIRLRRAVKSRDSLIATFAVSPYSRHIARWCADRGLLPNQVTFFSLLLALLSAAAASTGTRPGYLAAAALFLLSFVFDCVDGQMARYTLLYSPYGQWLDGILDRVKEYALYLGLIIGARRDGQNVWFLALTAMAILAFRHVMDYSFSQARLPPRNPRPHPDAAEYLRRTIGVPIAERWTLIAGFTAVTTPRLTFTVLILAMIIGSAYNTADRVIRSLRHPAPPGDRPARVWAVLADVGPIGYVVGTALPFVLTGLPAVTAGAAACLVLLADGGPAWAAAVCLILASAAASARTLSGRLDWLVPSVLQAAEYTAVIAITRTTAPAALPVAFALVGAAAYYLYDTKYRIRGRDRRPPRSYVWLLGGHEGRVLILALLAMHGGGAYQAGIAVVAIVLWSLLIIDTIAFMFRKHQHGWHGRQPSPEPQPWPATAGHPAGPAASRVRTG